MDALHPALFAVVVMGSFLVTSRLIRFVTFRVLRFLAVRSRSGRTGTWVARLPRVGMTDDNLEIFRRDQRVQATATLFSRVISTLLLVVAVVLILVRLNVDIAVLVGSAGFLGFALAISAQYSIQDFITGLHVLLEDRFYDGDEIEVGSGEHRTVGRVERVGMFSTRLRDDHLTLHIANRELVQVRNRSQRGHAVHIEIAPGITASDDDIRSAVKAALDHVTPGRTPGVVVDRLTQAGADGIGVDARLTAPLSSQQHLDLADEVRRRLEFED